MEKASLVFGNMPFNLPIPHASSPLKIVPHWNKLNDDFPLPMFWFCE
jgi:hypothetical protein